MSPGLAKMAARAGEAVPFTPGATLVGELAGIGGQQAFQQRGAHRGHRGADRQLHLLQPRTAARAQRPGRRCGQPLHLSRELCPDLRTQLL